jgi:hypothetical protein
MKILISAYHCEPDKGSELAVGWNWVLQLAKYHDVFVFTETGWRKAIERSLARNPIPRLTFTYIELPSWALFWEKGRLGFEGSGGTGCQAYFRCCRYRLSGDRWVAENQLLLPSGHPSAHVERFSNY